MWLIEPRSFGVQPGGGSQGEVKVVVVVRCSAERERGSAIEILHAHVPACDRHCWLGTKTYRFAATCDGDEKHA